MKRKKKKTYPSVTCIKCGRGAYEMCDRVYCCNCDKIETVCKCKPIH